MWCIKRGASSQHAVCLQVAFLKRCVHKCVCACACMMWLEGAGMQHMFVKVGRWVGMRIHQLVHTWRPACSASRHLTGCVGGVNSSRSFFYVVSLCNMKIQLRAAVLLYCGRVAVLLCCDRVAVLLYCGKVAGIAGSDGRLLDLRGCGSGWCRSWCAAAIAS